MREALQKAHATSRVLVTVTCSCGWWGEVGTTADCPTCGANEHSRLNPARAALLEKLGNPTTSAVAHIEMGRCPLVRKKLLTLRLIEGDGMRAPAGGNGMARPKGVTYTLTERGSLALAAYREMRATELKRKLAGETARRHAALPNLPGVPIDPCGTLGRADLPGALMTLATETTHISKALVKPIDPIPRNGWQEGVVAILDAGLRKPAGTL